MDPDKRRRELLLAALGVLAAPALAQSRSARIGILAPAPADRSIWGGPLVKNLAELGYRSGIEYRVAAGVLESYFAQARELVELKCDLIVSLGPEAPVRAVLKSSTAIPVLFIAVDFDPVEKGLVRNIARPDSNLTGIYVPQAALVAKRIELLREVMPKLRRLLVLSDGFSVDQLPAARGAARRLGMELTVSEFSRLPYDLEAAFEGGKRTRVEACLQLASPNLNMERSRVAALLAKHRLPAAGSTAVQAEAGYLLSLGPDIARITRRAAAVADRLLKGAKPADVPVEQADQFELVINSATAKALGLRMPESIMARATRIVA